MTTISWITYVSHYVKWCIYTLLSSPSKLCELTITILIAIFNMKSATKRLKKLPTDKHQYMA